MDHSTATTVHRPYSWEYADAAARAAATGFVTADLGKFARQLDTNTIWMLTAVTPTWVQAGGTGVSGPPTGAAGGVLSGTYPNPGFAVDMATQAELDAVAATIPTTEAIQDVVGAMMSDGGVDFTYDDSGGVITNKIKVSICLACSDESTPIVAAAPIVTFRMPHAMTLTAVRASLTTAAATGSFTIDVKESGTTIFSTLLTIDATEKTSTTAAVPAVISDAALADDAQITVEVTDDASGDAVGLKIYLIGTRS